MSEPREYTEDEVRQQFLEHVWHNLEYWLHEERAATTRDKMEGLVHSIFCVLDGCSMGLPGFIVAPCPHEDDEEFNRANGESWFPSNYPLDEQIKSDIGGCLHELWYQAKPKAINDSKGE